MDACVHMCMCACMCGCAHVCMCASVNVRTCACGHVCMNSVPSERVCVYVLFIMLELLLSEYDYDQIMLFITHSNPTFACVFKVVLNHSKIIPRILFYIIPIYLFYIAVTPTACILCLSVFQIWCLSFMKITPNWLTILLIMLSNGVQLNPEPSPQNFNFMTWNVNSIAKDNFERVGLIEAQLYL